MRFSRRELRDFAAAWLALTVAFALFFNRGLLRGLLAGVVRPDALFRIAVESLVVVGTGFLLHELAHKVVAVRFGQVAEFRADYSMLGLAVVSALAGFLFAAPGAVHHRGRITPRENGLIALAGPAVNAVLAVGFLGAASVAGGSLATLGNLGFVVNILLAGFNMLPFGPLDGRTVLDWSLPAFAVSFALTAGVAAVVLLGPLLPV
ncbi:MAG: metalloprotease [Haloarculaceae archaeon]